MKAGAVAAAAAMMIGLLVASLTTPMDARDERARPPEQRLSYWELDLSTPTLGAQAFIDAWTIEDYLLVVQLLDEPVRLQVVSAGSTGETLPLVMPGTPSAMTAELQRENVWPLWNVLVEWTGARSSSRLLIDLANAEIVSPPEAGSAVSIRLADGRDLTLRMVPSPSGRWNVAQIGSPTVSSTAMRSVDTDLCAHDSDPAAESCDRDVTELIPVPVDPDQIAAYRALDLSSPDAAVRTFVRLFDDEDYVRLFLAVDSIGQRDFYRVAVRAQHVPISIDGSSPMPSEQGEFGFGSVGGFDSGMRHLTEMGELLVDVRGSVATGRGTNVVFGEDDEAVLVNASSPHHPEGLGFVLVQSPAGRWRIRQVAAPATAADPDARLFVVGE